MGEFFSLEGPIFNFLGKIADIFLLNLLWLICCLPIVTAGASTTALYYVTLKLVKNEESYIIKSFFHSFKENFRQATLLFIPSAFVGAFILFDIYLCNNNIFPGSRVFVYLLGVIFFLYLMTLSYLFPVLSRFNNSLKDTVRNSLLMSMGHLPFTIIVILLSFGPVLAMCIFPSIIIFVLFIYLFTGGALTAYLNSFIFVRIFKKYMKPQDDLSE